MPLYGQQFPILAPNGTAAAPSYSFSGYPTHGFYSNGPSSIGVSISGTLRLQFYGTGIDILSNTGALRFGGSQDTILTWDAANTLALRNGTNAQTFRVYNTTDAGLTNYELARFSWVSNWFEIGTSAGGTGVSRGIVLMPATNIVAIGGTTSSFPALKRNGAALDFRLADDSAYATINTGAVVSSSTVFSVGAVYAYYTTGIPAGGSAGAGLKVSSTTNFGVFFGSGAPTLSAAKGSLYLRSDGSGTGDRMYVNTDGSTAWTAVTTAT